MKTKVLVISKIGSSRYALIKNHLNQLGVTFEVSPAVFLSGECPWTIEYNSIRRKKIFGFDMTKSEVGCFLAHREAWASVVKSNQVTLIIEDDARLMPQLLNVLDELSKTIENTDIILRLFSVHHPDSYLWCEISSEIKITRPCRFGSTTTAYILNPQTASQLLQHSQKFWMPVDDYIDAEHISNCTIMHVVPELVKNGDQGVSTIGNRSKPPQGFISILKREIIRAAYKFYMLIHREIKLWRLGIKFNQKIKAQK